MKRMPAFTKKLIRRHDRGDLVHRYLARVPHRVQHAEGGSERVRKLLRGGRSGLLQVVAADVDRIPLRRVLDRPRDRVDDQPAAVRRREDVRASGQVLLHDVVLGGAAERAAVGALLVGVGDVEAEQPGRRGVDRHRRVHDAWVDAFEKGPHVAEVGDRHADLADLSGRQRVVGVVAALGRKVEGDREARLPLGEVLPVERVRCLGRRVAGVGAHDPRAIALRQAVMGPSWEHPLTVTKPLRALALLVLVRRCLRKRQEERATDDRHHDRDDDHRAAADRSSSRRRQRWTPGRRTVASSPSQALAPGAEIELVSMAANHLEAFWVGTDGAAWHSTWTGTDWLPPESLGGSLGPGSRRSLAPRRDDGAVRRAADGALMRNSFTTPGTWSGWFEVAGVKVDGGPDAWSSEQQLGRGRVP